jgi:hypothetical protein
MLSASGLELRGTDVETRVTKPGEPHYEFARVTALESLPALVAAGIMDDADAERLEGYFGQSGTLITGASIVAAWGQKHA